MNIGNIISEIRKKKGYKQKDFAKKCDLSQAYLSQIENNRKEANISSLKKIASVLDIPLPALFFLSMDQKDIPENKKGIYEHIYPTIKALINDLFLKRDDH